MNRLITSLIGLGARVTGAVGLWRLVRIQVSGLGISLVLFSEVPGRIEGPLKVLTLIIAVLHATIEIGSLRAEMRDAILDLEGQDGKVLIRIWGATLATITLSLLLVVAWSGGLFG